MKKCSVCKTEKPLDDFGSNKSKKGGRQNECRPCRRSAQNLSYSLRHSNPRKRVTPAKDVQDYLDVYKGLRGCAICGEGDVVCIDFYHFRKSRAGKLRKVKALTMALAQMYAPSRPALCSNCSLKVDAGRIETDLFTGLK